MKNAMTSLLLAAALALTVTGGGTSALAAKGTTAPPGGAYEKVSKLTGMPDVLPGLGQLWVQPQTLPLGPFLAYDRAGHLVGTLYMVPLDEMDANKSWGTVEAGAGKVDHVTIDFNPGHPGVPKAHYHVGVWYVSPAQRAALK